MIPAIPGGFSAGRTVLFLEERRGAGTTAVFPKFLPGSLPASHLAGVPLQLPYIAIPGIGGT